MDYFMLVAAVRTLKNIVRRAFSSVRNSSRSQFIILDTNQAYGGDGCIQIHPSSLTRFQIQNRVNGLNCSDPLNNMWKIGYEKYQFNPLVF